MSALAELPDLSHLQPVQREHKTPEALRDELFGILLRADADKPRSRQTVIGPSEMGSPCSRKLGYLIAQVPKLNARPGWRPIVGTAVHEWIAEALATWNHNNDTTRFLLEMRVHVADVDGVPVIGSADAYDRATCTVIDWKIVGTTNLRNARAKRVKPGYVAQAHLYGRGFVRRGLPVERVTIAFLPASGELKDAAWHTEPYDESKAVAAETTCQAIALAMRHAGAGAIIPTLRAVDDYCAYCPWHMPGIPAATAQGCPGANAPKDLTGII